MSSKAVGLIETIGLAAAIEAADAASKAANVTLIGYENARGGGLITVKLVGDVGAVKAAVSAGSAAAQRVGKVASTHIIPRPHAEIESLIKSITRGVETKAEKETKSTRKKSAPKSTQQSQPEASQSKPPVNTPPSSEEKDTP